MQRHRFAFALSLSAATALVALGALAERPAAHPHRAHADAGAPHACHTDTECGAGNYCARGESACDAAGHCEARPAACPELRVAGQDAHVCGCDGQTYPDECAAHTQGMNVRSRGACVPPDGGTADAGCSTAADCRGMLPHTCRVCAGGATACAHWMCRAGHCDAVVCE